MIETAVAVAGNFLFGTSALLFVFGLELFFFVVLLNRSLVTINKFLCDSVTQTFCYYCY